MRKFFTLLLFGLSMLAWPIQAQEIDESYMFMDDEGNIIENGATVIRNVVESYDEGTEVIYSGIYVINMTGSTDFLSVHYVIEKIDNGTYQICFPTTCNTKNTVGSYETSTGQLMADVQNIESEWFPVADGECIVTLTIELYTKMGLFPPTYVHKGWGPTMTLRFVKGNVPVPVTGDVNGDGEVNIADVNAVIDMILSGVNGENGDVNGDIEVNIADVNAIIDIILKS